MDSPTLELTQALIARRSITREDAGCQKLVQDRLEKMGFACSTLQSGEVTNLWARRGAAPPVVCFAGHTDVVPTGPLSGWDSDPFTPGIRDGFLYGRGAADMKTSIAAFVTAVESFVARNPDHPGSIALLLTSDEEGPATDGTVKVVEMLAERGERFDFCIVGEPTSVECLGDMLKNGRRGSLSGKLTVPGLRRISRIRIWAAIPSILRGNRGVGIHDLGRRQRILPLQTWQISKYTMRNRASNIIPGTLEIMFNFRHSTVQTQAAIKARFEDILKKHHLDYILIGLAPGNRS